jgi:hypothetical protein
VWAQEQQGDKSRIVPVAWDSEGTRWLSTEPEDGHKTATVLMPLGQVFLGDLHTVFSRILVIVRTSSAENAGTSDVVQITIKRDRRASSTPGRHA